MLNNLKEIFSDVDFKYEIFHNVYDFRNKMLHYGSVDLIISDFYIKGSLTGLELTEWVRNVFKSDVPIIITTAIQDYEAHKKLIKAGANSIFLKPLSENFRRGLRLAIVNCLIEREKQKVQSQILEESVAY